MPAIIIVKQPNIVIPLVWMARFRATVARTLQAYPTIRRSQAQTENFPVGQADRISAKR
jgi:hypothetical protein